jgi:hypothetical protein
MRRTILTAVVGSALVTAVPVTARIQQDNFDGKFAKPADKHAVMGLFAASKHGKFTKVAQFDWDGLRCVKGNEGFTGGLDLTKPLRVRDNAFQGKRSVNFKAGAVVHATVKGKFTHGGNKAKGSVKLSGDCHWKDYWTARPRN